MFILDQTITGNAKSIQDVYVETSLNSSPNNDVNISDANPLKKINNIGTVKDNKNTFLNLILNSEILSLFFALANSGNRMSKLAATS